MSHPAWLGDCLGQSLQVAVLAVFSSLGANPDLYINVFGESVLNDAVAMVRMAPRAPGPPSAMGCVHAEARVVCHTSVCILLQPEAIAPPPPPLYALPTKVLYNTISRFLDNDAPITAEKVFQGGPQGL